jgi:predicted enzyme related to lactoylglutathione lyase
VLNRILIYAKDMQKMADFYVRHFSFEAGPDDDGRIVELRPLRGGAIIMLHKAATSQKTGQSTVKLVFDVEDVRGFVKRASAKGLKFGAVHEADDYVFANAKDPDGNSVSVSSRAFRSNK